MAKAEQIILLLKKYQQYDYDESETRYQYFVDAVRSFSEVYTNDSKEQTEIINICFRKAVMYFHQFKLHMTGDDEELKAWLKKMMLYAAVEYFRNNFKTSYFLQADNQELGRIIQSFSGKFKIEPPDVENILLQLPPSHRLVINLTSLYGLGVEELAQCLNITPQKAHFILIEATSRLEVLLSFSEPGCA